MIGPRHPERVRHGLIRHMAQVEDDLLAPHRLEQLPSQLRQAARRTRSAAVAGGAPGRAYDPHPTIGPGAKLRWGFDRVGALHQQHPGEPAFLPAAGVISKGRPVADEVEAAGAVVVDLSRRHQVGLVGVLVDESGPHRPPGSGRRGVEGRENQTDLSGHQGRAADQVARRGRLQEAPAG